jgi:hypothetical protein
MFGSVGLAPAVLNIARNLTLPEEAQTQTFGILAKRGMGKTYTMLVMAEEMWDSGLRFVIADPIGVCWGLRTSADGKRPGIPVLVLGGDHGDIPLEETSGHLVADLVVQEHVSCVLDLSRLRKGAQVRFMTEFAERLYHTNREPLHLFLDEADAFAPQRPQRGQERMLGAIEDIVRRGRARGLGATLVTQRSAVLNKNVLTQIECLVAFRMLSPQDRSALDEWIKAQASDAERKLVIDSLASLPVGTAWWWCPGWLDLLVKAKTRKRRTYDSSRTPTAKDRTSAKSMAEVDLEDVRVRMAATVERAQANDPRHLQRRIRELEEELARVRSEPVVDEKAVAEAVELERVRLERDVGTAAARLRERATQVIDEVVEAIEGHFRPSLRMAPSAQVLKKSAPRSVPAPINRMVNNNLPPARQRILNALLFLESLDVLPADRTQLALFADTSPKSSGYANNLGALRTAGYIDYPQGGSVSLTEAGRAIADEDCTIESVEELHAALASRLPPAKWRILKACIDAYPASLGRDELAERIGASPRSSGYANNLGSLRSLGLIDYPTLGHVAACSVLFLKG